MRAVQNAPNLAFGSPQEEKLQAEKTSCREEFEGLRAAEVGVPEAQFYKAAVHGLHVPEAPSPGSRLTQARLRCRSRPKALGRV